MRISDWSSDVCSSDLAAGGAAWHGAAALRSIPSFPDPPRMQPAARSFKAIVWMIGALASFATMTVSIRELTGEMHAFQTLLIRRVMGIAILLLVIARSRRGWGEIGWRCQLGPLMRNVIHFTGQVLW